MTEIYSPISFQEERKPHEGKTFKNKALIKDEICDFPCILKDIKFNNLCKIISSEIKTLVLYHTAGIVIDDCKIDNLLIKSGEENYRIHIKSNVKIINLIVENHNDLDLEVTSLENLRISKNSKFSLEYLKSLTKLIYEDTVLTTFSIKNKSLNEVILRNIKPHQQEYGIILDNVKFNSNKCFNINIIQSKISLIEFKNSNFRKSTMLIKDSEIKQIISYNVSHWFKSIFSDESKNENRDIYRKFKLAMIAENNRIDELYFKAKELNAYRRNLKFGKDKILLCLNWITNNYSLDFTRTIGWYSLLSVIAFAGYYYTNDYSEITNESIFQNAHKLFIFMNPTHGFHLFGENCSTFWSLLIDFFYRLISYYLIYQFIAAFRKFGARS